jgi:hypothetical protein
MVLPTSAIYLVDGWHAIGDIRDITERRQNEQYNTVYRIVSRLLTATRFQITLLGDAAKGTVLLGRYLCVPFIDSGSRPFGLLSLVSIEQKRWESELPNRLRQIN